MKWIERKFSFDYETWIYPAILSRLRGAPVRLEDAVVGLTPEEMTKSAGESWSIQEQAGHLWDLEQLWAARLVDFQEGKETLTAADMGNLKTVQKKHNQLACSTVINGFRTERERLLYSLEKLSPEDYARTAMHPRLQQPIRLVDSLYFAAEHDDHHLATIREMRKKLS